MPASPPPVVEAPVASAWGYRPHLDGLRAVAVYLVVAFHAGADRLSGGFIGVDVFFVLSGYLVTHVLLRSIADTGSIGLRRFYSRRFRRLLPAAAVVLVATPILFALIASPFELVDVKGAFQAASLYYSNWYFIGESSDYFAADVQANPVLHFWSLSVEEQFYLAWPLLLGGITVAARRAGDRQRAVVQAVVAGGLVASLGAALWISQTNVNRAYYGTDTRAYQLLAGALIALSPGFISWVSAKRDTWPGTRLWLRAVPVLALLALGLAASSVVTVGAVNRGVLATVITVVLVVSLEVSTGGLRRVLSLQPLVYLGKISYSTYLWHWIVILLLDATFEIGSLSTTAYAAAVATGLASLSYQLLEMPVRQTPRLNPFPVSVIAVGLAMSLLLGLVVTPRLLDRGAERAKPTVPAEQAEGQTPVPADLDWQAAADDHGEFPRCEASDPDECIVVEGAEPHIMLLGDSNARMYLPLFEELAEERDLTLSALMVPVCLWPEGIWRTFSQNGQMSCEERQEEWYGTIVGELSPDVVFLVHRAFDDKNSPAEIEDRDAGILEIGTPEYREVYEQRTRETIEMFEQQGIDVVIIEPAPVVGTGRDPLKCLSGATYLEECEFRTGRVPTVVEEVYREIAEEDPRVWTLDPDRELCPSFPVCEPMVGDVVVRWDHAHITSTYARSLLPWLEAELDEQSILS